jgi:acetylornithine deacetylase/succinyl-diaminopimelate desuccinylase-like protein
MLGIVLTAGGAVAAERGDAASLSRFRATYQELVETNTTLSAGDCTRAAEAMSKRLLAAGYPAADVQVIVPEKFPRQGNLVAVLRGTEPKNPAILLLAHIDVVEAKREDWERDPFKLVEENGYFYARGSHDDKAMAAVFVDSLVRYREAGFRPKRDIKLALTCGEETDSVFNGAQYLLEKHRPLIDAGFALNEGGRAQLDDQGKRLSLGIQVGEKVYQDFQLETTSPGGHSARPGKDNAITRLAAGLVKIGAYQFPYAVNDATRSFFKQTSAVTAGDVGADMQKAGETGVDTAVLDRLADTNPTWNSMMRTTCVATQTLAGHAPNALAQRATANVNCRILPGTPVDAVKLRLEEVLADPTIKVTFVEPPGPTSPPPPLTPAILDPAKKVAARLWPGVPVVPSMSTGATDGRYLNAAGLPTYGMGSMFVDPDGGGVHGLNERIRVRSLYEGREFLYEVVKLYSR